MLSLEFALGLVRHLLTYGGGWLTANGIAGADEVEAGIGAVVSLIGLGWSWWRKWKRA